MDKNIRPTLMKLDGLPPLERFEKATRGQNVSFETLSGGFRQITPGSECQILLDSGCTQDCIHCFLGQKAIKSPTQMAEVQRVGDNLRAQGRVVRPYPTEPFLSEEALDVYARFWDPLWSALLTNGNAPLLRGSVDQVRALVEPRGLNNIYMSLYGGSVEVHERLTRTPGSFQATMDSIEKFGKLREANPKLRLALMMVVHRENLMEMERVVAIAREHHFQRVYLIKLVDAYHGDIPRSIVMDHDATWDALVEVAKLRARNEGRVWMELGQSWGVNFHNPGIYKYLSATRSPFCPVITPRVSIHPGRKTIYPCHSLSAAPEMEIGRVEVEDSQLVFNDLGKQLLDWRSEWSVKAKGACADWDCPYSSVCQGGCRASALAPILDGTKKPDWFAPFPDCLTTILGEMA